MNEFVGVSLLKKELKRVFQIIDRDSNGTISSDELQRISRMTWVDEPENMEVEIDEDKLVTAENVELKGDEIVLRQEINDLYEEIRNKLESKGATLEQIFFGDGG